MTTKYCDHGAYGSCTFNGYISNTANNDNGVAGTTLTVTSVTAGVINIGSQLSGGAIVAGTYVSAFVSGTQGGAGVYTVAILPAAANQIVRATSGLTGIYAHPLNVPLAWGVPQEGDGTASTAATASATISADLSAATAAAGATISIMGAVLTCVASGASANQFNAGSGTTLIDNIVTAINRTTNTVTVTAQATGWATPKLQDTVYARRTGNNLEIMTRAGSATYNSSTVATSGLTGGTFGPYTFSGGSGGCWGYLFSWLASFLPSALGIAAYGVLGQTNLPLAGTMGNAPLGGDIVCCRSNKTVWFTTTGILPSATGSRTKPVEIVVDDGTVWSADGSTPVLNFKIPQSYSTNSPFAHASSGTVNIRATQYASGQRSLVVSNLNLSSSGYIAVNGSSGLGFYNIDFDVSASAGYVWAASVYGSGSPTYKSRFQNCRFKHKQNQPFFYFSTSLGANDLNGCEFDNTGASVFNSGVIGVGGHNSAGSEVIFESCKFVGFLTGSRLFSNGYTWSGVSSITLLFSNISWGNVGGRGPTFGGGLSYGRRYGRIVSSCSQYGTRDFHLDVPNGYVDWDSSGGYPTCKAKLLDGTTGWVLKVVLPVTAYAAYIDASNPFELPRIGKVIPTNDLLTEGIRTLTVEFAIEQSLTFTKSDIALVVTYQDTSGVTQIIDTHDINGGAFTDSTTTWSDGYSTTQVALYPGPTIHNKKKFSVTTPTAVKAGSEVGIYVQFRNNISGATQTIFVDPEIAVT